MPDRWNDPVSYVVGLHETNRHARSVVHENRRGNREQQGRLPKGITGSVVMISIGLPELIDGHRLSSDSGRGPIAHDASLILGLVERTCPQLRAGDRKEFYGDRDTYYSWFDNRWVAGIGRALCLVKMVGGDMEFACLVWPRSILRFIQWICRRRTSPQFHRAEGIA